MQTVIRLKRPLEESPSAALILNCSKKLKLEHPDAITESISTVFKFSATRSSTDEDITKQTTGIKNNLKEQFSQNYKSSNVDITNKLRVETQEHSKNERYKIVKFLRSNSNEDNPDECITVFDVELNEEIEKRAPNQKFVYDLYYTDAKFLETVDDYDISVVPTTGLFFSDDVYISDAESDDSNAENHYTNDYPNESDVESINEDDILEAMENCHIHDNSSSDEFNENEDSENEFDKLKRRYKSYNIDLSDTDGEDNVDSENDDDSEDDADKEDNYYSDY
ncbi:pheromone-processing carboxypeptidase KEX1 [Harmonia axyridis]|uniref:pheromone-processing carboxypeptidase KEX1 n=1 Tax=Harmonia axyridis TaxID=115357 RepID=UPI001E275C5F|nr:pheromone-processing carboxypeptidase KEX1 [Harmonia axyridis]